MRTSLFAVLASFLLSIAAPALPAASAQSLFAGIGSITVTPSTVSYHLPHRDTTVSRDLLAALPRAGRDQWVADDLALILDAAAWEGGSLPAFVPAADTSYAGLADSLETAARATMARADSLAGALAASQQAIAMLQQQRQQAVNERNQARQERDQAQQQRDQAIAERDAALAEAQAFRDFARSVRRVVELLSRQ